MISNDSVGLVVILAVLSLGVVALGGWVLNIVQLFGFDSVTPMFIVKIVGVFVAPIGAILGIVGAV